jgi:hypothetical protein
MVKIVYNACFGGFGLSHEGIKRYGEIKGLNLVYVPDERYESLGTWYLDGIKDDDHYFSTYDFDRKDPALVQVVEELGEKANGEYARLAIVELEEGTRYRIDEYDGRESVMTVFDYDWSIA